MNTDEIPIGKGSLIGTKYMVLDRLGAGGYGTVFRCCLASAGPSGPQFAVKVLTGTANLARFRREADILWRTTHPNIVKCSDYGKNEDRYYIVMDYANGGSLEGLLDKGHTYTPAQVAWIGYQAAAGLQAGGMVHRDIKPGNLLIICPPGMNTPDLIPGDMLRGARVLVADWGLAKDDADGPNRLTVSSQIMGSPLYMSPDQARSSKHCTVASDMYSLGVVMYEAALGYTPFTGDEPLDVLRQHIESPVPWPPALDASLRVVLERCLAKEAKGRYRDMLALRDALRPILGVPDSWAYMADPAASGAAPTPTPVGWFGRLLGRKA